MNVKHKLVAGAAIMAIGAAALSGCSSAATPKPTATAVSADDVAKAMSTPTTITYWSWATISPGAVSAFEAKYPQIKVDLVNLGAGPAQYQKLRTALKAGSGAPDVAFMDYAEIPSFRLSNDLVDLTPYGAADLEPSYIPSSWAGVANSDGVWALPNGGQPMISLYRTDLLAQAGITSPPTTWQEFADDAALVKAKTGAAMANLPSGSAVPFLSFLQQAGTDPFSYSGNTVGINLDTPTTEKVAQFWQDLISKGEVTTDADFTNDWFQSIGNGKYASLQIGPWGPGVLSSTSTASNGKWTAAAMPEWTAGDKSAGTWVSGSADVVLNSSKNKTVAAEFVKFIDSDPTTVAAGTTLGQFPPLKSVAASDAYINATTPFTGDQKVNQVSLDVANNVTTAQTFLPFYDYVASTYTSTVGAASTSKGDLVAAVKQWQQQLIDYAKQQGFTVK